MRIEEAIEILENHNKWRRGDENIELVNPVILGIAIDTIIEYFKGIK